MSDKVISYLEPSVVYVLDVPKLLVEEIINRGLWNINQIRQMIETHSFISLVENEGV